MQPDVILAGGMGLVLLLVVARLFWRPLQWIGRVLANSLLAVVAIFLWNHWADHHGLGIGLNPVTALAVGILGIPGFALLLALRLFGV
ncbi:MAG: pro-sigmaK processing inhibitor BofA family protein [Firmicutes bacterium]|nr:pro-sigmaK processing inhibitor BofA family protein [Bacillota bacterium]MCL5066109.1 pro-sigmaK processing inhibitor BofA family protein [Bacillota bacterium]